MYLNKYYYSKCLFSFLDKYTISNIIQREREKLEWIVKQTWFERFKSIYAEFMHDIYEIKNTL